MVRTKFGERTYNVGKIGQVKYVYGEGHDVHLVIGKETWLLVCDTSDEAERVLACLRTLNPSIKVDREAYVAGP